MKPSTGRAITSAAIGLAVGSIVFWITYGALIRRLQQRVAEANASEKATYLARGIGQASWGSLGAGAGAAIIGALVCWGWLGRRR